MEYELYHHGIKGQKWGVRRYQNKDGSLTAAGKRREKKDSIKRGRAVYNQLYVDRADLERKLRKEFDRDLSKMFDRDQSKMFDSVEEYEKWVAFEDKLDKRYQRKFDKYDPLKKLSDKQLKDLNAFNEDVGKRTVLGVLGTVGGLLAAGTALVVLDR